MKNKTITLTIDKVSDGAICEIAVDQNLNVIEAIMPLTQFTEEIMSNLTTLIEEGFTSEHLKDLTFREYYKITGEDE